MPNTNRDSSWTIYQDRVRPVLEFVHQNLDTPLTLEKAAALSHFSKYHFQRIFSAVVGESLVQYTNRLRLERAANLLLFNQQSSVTDIAMALGFSSSTNFTRAFKDHFGVPPVQVRKGMPTSELDHGSAPKITMDRSALGHVYTTRGQQAPTESIIEPVRIFTQSTQPLCVLRSQNGYQLPSIFQCWADLIEWGIENGVDGNESTKLALCHDNPIFTPADKCRYDAAFIINQDQLDKVQAPFQLGELEGGKYAVFHYQGTPEEVQRFHLSLYAKWLPYSGYEPDGFPLIEHYHQPFSEDNRDSQHRPIRLDIEIWLKVKKLKSMKELTLTAR